MRGTVTTQPEEVLVRRGLALAWFIVLWDVIEGVVAVTAGLAANSIALIGFGIDSAIEGFAASVVIWQLRGGAQTRQQLALRLIGLTFFALSAAPDRPWTTRCWWRSPPRPGYPTPYR